MLTANVPDLSSQPPYDWACQQASAAEVVFWTTKARKEKAADKKKKQQLNKQTKNPYTPSDSLAHDRQHRHVSDIAPVLYCPHAVI